MSLRSNKQTNLIADVLDSSMEVAEAIDSRPPLAALSPCQQNTDAGDVDFSKLTPSQFGISSDSFLPSSKIKDKSRLAQLKARRRSSIGVRGSPETNSLICFRAKQAAKTPPRTPQLLQGSPFLSRCDSLKKKMAVFQCLMEEEEEEGKGESRKNEENENVESTLAKESQNGQEHMLTTQSSPSSITPPPSKKHCRAPPVGCEDKITDSSLPYPTLTTQQEQGESKSLVSDSKIELLSLPMLSKPEIKATDEFVVVSICKKKRVRFGAPLSPEFFDKTLPPSTPLQKGGTPMCPPSSTGKKRSLLKTPQRYEPPLPQPDFNSPQNNGASPVLVIDRCKTGLVYSDDVFEEIEKISFPNMDEESPSNRPSESCKDTLCDEDSGLPQAEDAEVMNAAFQEDVPSDSQTEEKLPSQTGDQPLAFSTSLAADADLESESVASTEPTRSRSRKRKQPGDSEPEKRRSTRTAATSASGKMKNSSGVKRRFGNKDVDRSLYGKRDYASKNPLLSPIFETTSTSFNSTPIQAQAGKLTDGKQDCNQMPTVSHSKAVHPMVSLENAAAVSEGTLANENEQNMTCLEPSASTQGPTCRRDSGLKVHKSKRNSGRPAHQWRRSGTVKRNGLSGPAIDSTTESEVEMGDHNMESQESIVAASLDPMKQDNPDGTALHQAEHSEKEEAETLVSCDTPTMIPNGDQVTTERSEQKTPRHGCVQKTLKSPCVKVDVVEEVDMNGQSERVDQTESSESKTGLIEPGLAPWQQTDFNIDDILKPVAKSRGSVRRSLRNRRSVDLQAVGLAWVDHTSPELSKATRRRTRGRLSGVSEPLVIQASEEPTPNLGE
ncbi:cell division cycle-associated protein 2-like isoform X2 [Myxocyprinus asiaticus]|uniref:cell division cycle-associated protein 2-like isoform X2 n=1 Tax=Myxocyprinus asiaticus TaxID=70543 RepID=UPI002221DF66|nr:cell division cycle-associated protein 2-like isoform X2 [Myxocyprinus asiaticus]